jgi:hypothetical protein
LDTTILEEVHAALDSSKLDDQRAALSARWNNLAARKAMFQQAWQERDVALLETMRMPRITGDLGNPYATVRMPIAAELLPTPVYAEPASMPVAAGINRPVIQHPVIAQIGKAVDRYYLAQGHAPEIVLCWAMDLLLLGGPAEMNICTDIVSCRVRLITEREQTQVEAQQLICSNLRNYAIYFKQIQLFRRQIRI